MPLKNFVTTPLLPSNNIQEYAPINGADIEATIIRIFNNDFPFILNTENRYARGVPIASDNNVAAMDTLKLLNRVSK